MGNVREEIEKRKMREREREVEGEVGGFFEDK